MANSEQEFENLKAIFRSSVAAVKPKQLIRDSVRVQNNILYINNDCYPIKKPMYVVGFGKAVFDMALETENILGKYIKKGVVNVPEGITASYKCKITSSKILFLEGARNNLPDENSEKGAKLIKSLVEKLESDDLLLVLISGGGSALLPLPKQPITLNEKLTISKNLSECGATIQELNCVRKNISLLKGGGLAKLAYPAQVISLILSDIIDDPLEYIASGPTVPNFDTKDDAAKIIKKYLLYEQLPSSIKSILETENKFDDCKEITSNGSFIHVRNYIIGNNKIAANAALAKATSLGYQTFVLSTRVSGEVDRISKIYAELARQVASLINSGKTGRENLKVFLQSLQAELNISESTITEIINFNFNFSKGICLILAGEPTVVVKGSGKGGRNQELALSFSIEINKFNVKSANVSFLSCGTDGIDGPTDAAGALGTSNLVNNALETDINPTLFLQDNDSYGFYSTYNKGEYLIHTGHTGTNVMDIHLLIVSSNTV
ncbi:hypothetical protein RN001_002887 [Aquatica leii]|uniref:Glycerate kinase n=1 Tax=Aquatica leii TaxID=1421715 RepID=A0AAN7PMY2_9COLE|nr:hypothetical protein RN001_002887 [Aquatica leii]